MNDTQKPQFKLLQTEIVFKNGERRYIEITQETIAAIAQDMNHGGIAGHYPIVNSDSQEHFGGHDTLLLSLQDILYIAS